MTFKEEENLPLTNSNTLTINSNMDSANNNFGKSFTLLVDITLKQSLLKNSTNTFKRNLPVEKSHSDFDLLSSLLRLNV